MTQHDLDNFAMTVVFDALGFTPEVLGHGDDWLELKVSEVCFDTLATLSDLFGTRNINVRTERESSGGCETCNFYYEVGFVRLQDISKWPDARKTLWAEKETA